MKNIQDFNAFNEELFYNKNDDKFKELIDDIKHDFKENNNDLRKVKIIDNTSNNKKIKINFKEIEYGNNYTISYIFGKYHPVTNSNISGNREYWSKRVKIDNIPTSFKIKKDELDKMFNTSRLNIGRTTVYVEHTKPNLNRNPNIGNNSKYIVDEDRYNVSTKLSSELFKYFIDEYNNKYPDIKLDVYKDELSIKRLEDGIPNITKYKTVKSKDNKFVTVPLYKGYEDLLINKAKSLNIDDFDIYIKQFKNNIYNKSININNDIEKSIIEDIKKNI